ncbi:MAG: GNAT family N-acetyltransferase [bacterium]|nr:GNAT family N-acetyltransferase [bacterium]
MADVLMVANPQEYTILTPPGRQETCPCEVQFLSATEFCDDEQLYRAYEEELWRHFRTRGKRASIERCASHFAVAHEGRSEGRRYLGSACVVTLGAKWLVEYVVVKREIQSRGIGSWIMNVVMRNARLLKAKWVILNCDPGRENGKLLRFYQKFGFTVVAS